jgi:integrase/recombinase XerD
MIALLGGHGGRRISEDFLGHVDVKTTEIYARANLEMKRTALEKINESSPVQTTPSTGNRKEPS